MATAPQLVFDFNIRHRKHGWEKVERGIGATLAEAQSDLLSRYSNYDIVSPVSDTPTGQRVETRTATAGKRATTRSIVGVNELPEPRFVDLRSAEDIRLEGLRQTPRQLANAGATAASPAPQTAMDIITDPVTGNRYYRNGPTDTYKPYTGQQTTATTTQGGVGMPSRQSGESIADFTQRIGTTSGYSSSGGVVGTSFAERYKELQKELGLGKAPTAPDYFTGEDKERLGTARDERTAIEAEMATILNERLAIDEELQKFGINAGEGTTEAGRIGAVSEAQRNANERLQVLNRRELVLETRLRNRQNTISELMQAQRLEYTDAVEQYDKSYTRALQIYNIVQEEASELKQSASANLSVLAEMYQAQINQGMDISDISRAGRRQLEELELQSGRPVGSTLALLQTMKPTEKELFSKMDDNGNFYQVYQTPDGSVKTRVLPTGYRGDAPSGGGSSGGSAGGGGSSGGSTGGLSTEAQRIIDGFGSLSDLTPSKRTSVSNELYGMGFGDDTPPEWFREYIEDALRMNLTSQAPKEEWAKYRDSILNDASGGDGFDFDNL